MSLGGEVFGFFFFTDQAISGSLGFTAPLILWEREKGSHTQAIQKASLNLGVGRTSKLVNMATCQSQLHSKRKPCIWSSSRPNFTAKVGPAPSTLPDLVCVSSSCCLTAPLYNMLVICLTEFWELL